MRYMFCTDGSESAEKALVKAAELATHPTDTIVLVHLWSYPSGFLKEVSSATSTALNIAAAAFMPALEESAESQQEYFEYSRNKEKEATALLEESRSKLIQLGMKPEQIRFIHEPCDDPRTGIIELAEKEHIDVIIMGTRGLGLLSRLMLGSVSNYVVQHASCSVLVVR
jgi:nucleotide-binding universal stress UspA family protein